MSVEDETKSILNSIRIASPCPMAWDAMERTPEEAVRFCGECRKNVYNVAQMSSQEASLLLQKASANQTTACMQLYRRKDGTIITDDCPVGLRRIRDSWRKVQSAAAALIAVAVSSLPALAQPKNQSDGSPQPLRGEPTMMTGGAPAPVNWQNVAMANPAIKKLSDQIETLEKKGNLSREDKLKVSHLRLEMAEIAQKGKIPYFAMGVLEQAQSDVQALSGEKDLLRAILKAQISNYESLGMDAKTFKDQLSKLEKGK